MTPNIKYLFPVKKPGHLKVTLKNPDDNTSKTIEVKSRIDTNAEVDYFTNGGLLQFVLRKLLNK